MMSNQAIIILLLCIAIALQVYLSKRENKWLGLILPSICVIFSIIAVIGVITFSNVTTQGTTVIQNGEVIEQIVDGGKNESSMSIASMLLSASMMLVVYNIPTLILLSIYFGCREKYKRNLQLEKMSIQDLE